MPTEILMPALSPTMEEGTLAKWLVKEGDTVSSGDLLAEIETDKATMEVEAVDDGVLAVILVEAGSENVAVGTPIARLAEDGEAVDDVASAPAAAAPSPPVAEAKVESSAPAAPLPAQASAKQLPTTSMGLSPNSAMNSGFSHAWDLTHVMLGGVVRRRTTAQNTRHRS